MSKDNRGRPTTYVSAEEAARYLAEYNDVRKRRGQAEAYAAFAFSAWVVDRMRKGQLSTNSARRADSAYARYLVGK